MSHHTRKKIKKKNNIADISIPALHHIIRAKTGSQSNRELNTEL